MERLDLDGCLCLGDVAQGGAQPAESLARLRRLGCRAVIGNSDAFLLEVPVDSPEPVTEQHLEVRDWTLSRLAGEDLAFMASFEPLVETTVGASTRVIACHGSPRSFDDVLLPWSDEAALEPFKGVDADLLAGGHTHIQWSRQIGGTLFVNPGSVGLAYDHHQPEHDFLLTPIAEYAILTGRRDEPAVEFRRVPYPADEFLEIIRASGRPHAEAFARQWRMHT